MARYIGIDHGSKRIGLAVSDPGGSIASPLKTISAARDWADQVRDVVKESADFDVDEWVVGHPLNMDGSEGPQGKLTRRFAEALRLATSQPVHLWDERLSTAQADIYLADGEFTRKQRKGRRDKVAAQVILQSFLDARVR